MPSRVDDDSDQAAPAVTHGACGAAELLEVDEREDPAEQVVGQVAADLRSYRPPEPYKGKGVRYLGEKVVMKEAKKK